MKKWILTVVLIIAGLAGILFKRPHNEANESTLQREIEMMSFSNDQDYEEPEQTMIVEVPKEENANPSKQVLDLVDPTMGYEERLNSMRQLGYAITSQDLEVMMKFLSEEGNNSELSSLAYNSIRNDALELLLRQQKLPEGMGDLLLGVVTNSNHDAMWRNYCVQFLPEYLERSDSEKYLLGTNHTDTDVGTAFSTNRLEIIQGVMWQALEERDNSNAGTALLGLEKLARNNKEFDQALINDAMLSLVQDADATLANRVTALRLCGERGVTNVLEIARDLANDDEVTMMRCAAIATLGEIGTEEDVKNLNFYTKSRDKRIAQVATAALNKRMQHESL